MRHSRIPCNSAVNIEVVFMCREEMEYAYSMRWFFEPSLKQGMRLGKR